jgi:hypothetical protein
LLDFEELQAREALQQRYNMTIVELRTEPASRGSWPNSVAAPWSVFSFRRHGRIDPICATQLTSINRSLTAPNGGSARFPIGGLSTLGDRLADDRSSLHERARLRLARRAGI